MKILITGGLGYIGSHLANLLGKKAIIIDNMSNSSLNFKKYLPKAKVSSLEFYLEFFLLSQVSKQNNHDYIL